MKHGAPRKRAAAALPIALGMMTALGTAPAAHAQDAAELASTLSVGVRCQSDRAIGDLSYNLARAGEDNPALVLEALTRIGDDAQACEPLRAAAASLVEDRRSDSEIDGVNTIDAARAVVDATLAEAERRAASLKFEVGPPPLNLSRERTGGS